ncbi:MAG: fatty acid--CoA ligase family protein [Bacillota bacterium]|nr:fatty acid--CoA ligase family protein [Bacillota bacterium]
MRRRRDRTNGRATTGPERVEAAPRLPSRWAAAVLEWAERQPGATALAGPEEASSYGELREAARQVQSLLEATGRAVAGAGLAGALALPNGLPFVASLLAAAASGRPVALFPPGLPPAEAARQAQEAGASWLLLPLEGEPTGRPVLARSEALGLRLERLEAGAGGWRPGDLIAQLTSGAEQAPKLAVRTEAAVWNEIVDFAADVGRELARSTLVSTSLAHSYALIGGTMTPLALGGQAAVAPAPEPGEVLALARRCRPALLFGVPALYQRLAEAEPDPEAFRSVVCFLSAGAPLERPLHDAFQRAYGRRVGQDYGSTEAGVIALRLAWSEELDASAGRPVRHREVSVVGRDGEPLPPGQVGEVVVRSPALARAYLSAGGEERARAAGLDRGLWRSGDVGWLDAEGNLFLAGRRSQFVRVGGREVDTRALEAAVAAHPGVREVAAVPFGRAPGGEEAAGLRVVVAAAPGVTRAEVLERCRSLDLGEEVPVEVRFLPALPRSAAGKILRPLLAE